MLMLAPAICRCQIIIKTLHATTPAPRAARKTIIPGFRTIANHIEEVKKQAWNSITEAVWQYADSHGRVNLDNKEICMVGKN